MHLVKTTTASLALLLVLAAGGSIAAPEHTQVLVQADVPAVLVLDGETYYVVEDHGALQIWQETNGVHHGGQTNRLTREATGLQLFDFCLLDDGTLVYLEEDDHGHGAGHESDGEDEHVGCAEGLLHEADTRITNGHLLGRVRSLLP